MNSKERMAKAMHHQVPDRVPVMCQLTLGHYFINMADRWKPYEIALTSEAFADSLLTLRERYRFDGILINIPGRDPDLMQLIRTVEDREDGQLITWKNNTCCFIPWDDNPQYFGDGVNQVPDFEHFDPDTDLDHLDRWPGYTWGVYNVPHFPDTAPGLLQQPPDYYFRTIELVRAAAGSDFSIHGEVFSPFTHFLELFGYEQALIALATDAEKASAILQRLADATIAWAEGQARHNVDAVLISSAFAGASFISSGMYERFVVPAERKVVDAIHADFPNLPVYVHTCGKLHDRLELLVETHTDGIDTLDPPPLGDVQLADAKARIGRKLFIKGNMNSVALLTDNEPQVRERARTTLQAGKPDGGYILSTACSVAPHVEPWKLEMLVDIADEHGRYEESP